MQKSNSIVFVVSFMMMTFWTFSVCRATGLQPIAPPGEEDTGLTIFAYENPPFTTMKTPGKGILAEIALEAIKDAEAEVAVDVTPVKSLMKYSLIQDTGLAALGNQADFTADELKQLTEIPIYEKGDAKFSIFFNNNHEKGESLAERFRKNLEKMKKSGRLDEIIDN